MLIFCVDFMLSMNLSGYISRIFTPAGLPKLIRWSEEGCDQSHFFFRLKIEKQILLGLRISIFFLINVVKGLAYFLNNT